MAQERGPGLQGQESGEGNIRPADAAVSTDKPPYGEPAADLGEELENLRALDKHTAVALVSVTRAMYPHDRIPDKHYARVVSDLDGKAAEDAEMKKLLEEGVEILSAVSGAEPADFGNLAPEAQTEALERIQNSPFFKAVAGDVVTGLYGQPDIWPYFGYEGPANHLGGYVNRGFNDLDWVESAPDRRDNPVERVVNTEERISRAREEG